MSGLKEKLRERGVHSLSPHLVCRDAGKAMEFYARAFGAEEMIRVEGPDGRLMHGCVRINGSSVMLVDEAPEWNLLGPGALKGTPVTIHLIVDDADDLARRATEAGAKTVMSIDDMFWGDRYGVIEDRFGHRWAIATPRREVSPDEIRRVAAAMTPECGPKN
ncbi:MAG: VOC family protein [Flavobacteriaceae bacterium]